MGADLICYIAFGPEQIRLDKRRTTQIARQVRMYLDACVEAAEQVLLGRKDVSNPRKSPVAAKRSVTLCLELQEKPPLPKFNSAEQLRASPDYQSLIQDVLNHCDHAVESRYVFAGTPQSLAVEIQEFADGWNKGCFRDMAARQDPDNPARQIVVAGDMSWGDEPDGLGYQLLKKAFGLGIAQLLGVQ